jgi:hypothetical protein
LVALSLSEGIARAAAVPVDAETALLHPNRRASSADDGDAGSS